MKNYIALGLIGLTMVSCKLKSENCSSVSSSPSYIQEIAILPDYYYPGNYSDQIHFLEDKRTFIQSLMDKEDNYGFCGTKDYPEESCTYYPSITASSEMNNKAQEKAESIYSPKIIFNSQSLSEWSFHFKKDYILLRKIHFIYPFVDIHFESIESISDKKSRQISLESFFVADFLSSNGKLNLFELIHCSIQSKKKGLCKAYYWQASETDFPQIESEKNQVQFVFDFNYTKKQKLSYDFKKETFQLEIVDSETVQF